MALFVTVGNATQGFRRLLDEVERLVHAGAITEPVVMQTGNNPSFASLRCQTLSFVTPDQFARLVAEADIVVCHAGAGTLLTVLAAGKTPVVMPRRAKYDEIIDDHQLELLEALASEGNIIPAREPDDLERAIVAARSRSGGSAKRRQTPRLVELVASALVEIGTREANRVGSR